MKKIISVVIPLFNEEDNIPTLYQELMQVFEQLVSYEFELIFVDDGSSDASWVRVQELACADPCIKAIKLSRNFGHQMALSAGYDCASGDAIISMDADLQDPPELLVSLIAQWQQGASIVYARRRQRNDSWAKRTTARMYYLLLDHVSDVRIPRYVGDFRLIDKKVLRQLNNYKERFRYLRGLTAWTGFDHAFVDFDRPNRRAGCTGYTWQKMFRLAFDGLTGFSLFPLRIAAGIGFLVLFSGTLCGLYASMSALLFGSSHSLSVWLGLMLYNLLGVQLMCMWLLGEYVGRIYDQQKERPLYIVDESIQINTTFTSASVAAHQYKQKQAHIKAHKEQSGSMHE